MLAEGVHRAISRIRMHPTAGPKDHTRHAIVGEMHRVGTWAANDRRLSRTSSRFLSRTESPYYWKRLINEHRRITHIDIERGLWGLCALREAMQHAAQLALYIIHRLAGHRADIEIEAALVGIARQPPW